MGYAHGSTDWSTAVMSRKPRWTGWWSSTRWARRWRPAQRIRLTAQPLRETRENSVRTRLRYPLIGRVARYRDPGARRVGRHSGDCSRVAHGAAGAADLQGIDRQSIPGSRRP